MKQCSNCGNPVYKTKHSNGSETWGYRPMFSLKYLTKAFCCETLLGRI